MPHGHSVREAINEREVHVALADTTKGYGGVVRFARRLGVSRQYVNNMLYAGTRISVQVAAALGFELRWVRRNPPQPNAPSKPKSN
jgi:hypothetical protein